MTTARVSTTHVGGGGTARRVVEPLLVAVAVGLGVGVLTSYLQLWLPAVLAPLANTATSWCVVAGLAALRARSWPVGALAAASALFAMNGGYWIGSELRGYTYGTSALLFWAVLAVVAGPVVGAGVQWVRQDRPLLAPVSTGVLAGIAVGESVYGLTVVAETTPTAYWVGQLVVVAVAAAAVAALRLRTPPRVLLAVATAAVLAALFLAAYQMDLLLLLS